MSTPRQHLIDELNQAVQLTGNRTVIFTHLIADHIGLSASEFECLDFLQQCGAVPAGRLADLTGLTTGAITGLINRLERAGFVRRRTDPTDRRRVLVEAVANQAATNKIIQLYQPVSQGFSEIVEHYSDEEIATITRYLSESVAMIERITDDMVNARKSS